MSYSYLLAQTNKEVCSLRKLELNDIFAPSLSIKEIQSKISELHDDLSWEEEGAGVYFGNADCHDQSKLEIWIFIEKPCFSIKIARADKKQVTCIASKLAMVVFDLQSGELIPV